MASDLFLARREEFAQQIGSRAVAVFRAPQELLRNGDSSFPYRQSSDLYYLSGFAEPGSALVMRPGAEKERVIMFVRPRDPTQETWTGRRAGVEGAKNIPGVDAAYPISELETRLPALLASVDDLYYSLGCDSAFDSVVTQTIFQLRLSERRVGPPPKRVVDPREVLHELRLRKSADEINLLEKAAAITREAHHMAMRACKPGVFEYELQAIIEYEFRKRGAAGPGYTTIVGAGKNGTILHYIENESAIVSGELVLIDAGAEFEYYTADVTRTFPCGGRFSKAQRQAYNVVLDAQQQAIEMTRPGVTIDEIHDKTVAVLTEGMIALGLLTGTAKERVADGAYKKYYMHRTSHWLGMDVHDVGAYQGDDGKPRPLEPGMVITIEPGLYVAHDDKSAPEALRGIGIRIEDDIVVTADGYQNLTGDIAKDPDEIERLLAQ